MSKCKFHKLLGEAVKTNDEEVAELLKDTEFLNRIHMDKAKIKDMIETAYKNFESIRGLVAEYKGTFAELYHRLQGWNLAYDEENDDDNLFDCYYGNILVTVTVDDGKLAVQPQGVYVYPTKEQTESDTDELLVLDMSKPTNTNILTEEKEVLVEDEELDEAFYEKICRAYIDTMNLEFVFVNPENNNSIAHGYFPDDETAEKCDYGKAITPENYRDFATEVFGEPYTEDGSTDEIYEYDTWEDFYEDYVKENIEYDIQDIGTYSYDDEWDFYISKEDLIKLGLWSAETDDVPEKDYNYIVKIKGMTIGYYADDKEDVIEIVNDFKTKDISIDELELVDKDNNELDIKEFIK